MAREQRASKNQSSLQTNGIFLDVNSLELKVHSDPEVSFT